jgi:hypothetical protein
MGTIKVILGLVVMLGVGMALAQILPPVLANYSFQDDLRQIAMVGGSTPNRSDEDLLKDVLKKAKEHEIELEPAQVKVQRIGTPGALAVYVAADYSAPVNLPGYSFTLHFTPSSANKGF